MPTTFSYTAAAATGAGESSPAVFDYAFAYEPRDLLHTSRWLLEGVRTPAGGNTGDGWLWMTAARAAATVTIRLYKDPACAEADQVAAAEADISAIDQGSVECELSAVNASGLSGELCLHSYAGDPPRAIPLLVSLCTDADLRDEYHNLETLPADVYDASAGMARFCAAATRKVLLLASQQYAQQLGGYGAPEHRYRPGAAHDWPDYRRIANPDQLKDAAVHWALMLAFGSCHDQADQTVYSALRDYHDLKRKEAVAGWNLAFDADGDCPGDADESKSNSMRPIVRL